ncbi:T9SS C-terminal target domain-containing protein [Fulvivirga sp. RKSG066]|uniref:T9SS C-terminal target domain-containing protein n=1 Tax=Fulvivirga aurantia TaxID=2529383 RepID=UPI0012BD6B7E|nr:T9SS C-terminal target domain-containing protein [Fulvivirga aurantia]MTI22598.1 T9SS C-terminal target domain-containing protein [Fulvivirga aurantia]
MRILWLAIAITIFGTGKEGTAAELVLSGAYQGKDIYVQNPYDPATKLFCTQEVYVNDRQIYNQPRVSAYRIDLSYLSINDLVVIRITHSEGCKPRVVNPQVLKTTSSFKFLTAETDNNSINWMTQGERGGGVYIIEQETEEKDWHIIDNVPAKEALQTNSYTVNAPHTKGVNNYRVKYQPDKGEAIYSMEMAFSQSELITFYPSVATTTLTLSDSARYVITDYFGKEVKQGEGIEITIDELKPGEYYLNIQNRKEKFVKK